MRAQVAALVPPGFVAATRWPRVRELVRYLRAVLMRLEAVVDDPARDQARMAVVQGLAGELATMVDGLGPERRSAPDVLRLRWQLEELRVSLFAQVLRTPEPVSEKRVRRALAALAEGPAG